MPRDPIPAWFFALVVVRDQGRFLLVEECEHGGGWYLPAGRVEPGETLVGAAVREVREEAGIEVALDGVHRVQHTPLPNGTARCRVIFAARPSGDTTPKSTPDMHSLSAGWFTLEQARTLRMRADEVCELLELAAREPPHALSILGIEPE